MLAGGVHRGAPFGGPEHRRLIGHVMLGFTWMEIKIFAGYVCAFLSA